jgi:DNA end-binding protein Ku
MRSAIRRSISTKALIQRFVTAKARPRGENVVDLMDALRQSIGKASSPPAKPDKKTRKASAGQKEMLMPIQGKKGAKETTAKKPASRQRKSA